ncbi:MAG TPA: amidohydrolase family protein [bacterium]|nr:amidohydrolase family protein [bacterium]
MQGQPLDEAQAAGFGAPPPRAVSCPILDIHTHMTEPATNHELVDAARRYGVTRLGAITTLEEGLALRRRYPREVEIVARPPLAPPPGAPRRPRDKRPPEERALDLIPSAAANGVRIIKFWFAPRIRDRLDFLFDSPRLDGVFRAIADHHLGVLVHVSDPDLWFAHKYDPAKYGTKADQYPMLEHRLREHPTIPFLAAHMGGDPEHLDHLADLLTRYPNLCLDTSATKWIVRELGRQRDAARAFFRRWADRICFGTDQVVYKESDPVRYLVRYWVHQMFWETDLVCPSPIPDPDADGTPMLRGLDLPGDVLEQIYWKTAKRAFAIDARPAAHAAAGPGNGTGGG